MNRVEQAFRPAEKPATMRTLAPEAIPLLRTVCTSAAKAANPGRAINAGLKPCSTDISPYS